MDRAKENDMRFAAILALSLAASVASYAPVRGQGVNLDAVAALPGAQTTTTVHEDGSEDTEVKLPNGVTFHQVRRDGNAQTFANDVSGHGAVLCSWGIYVALEAALEVCPEYRDEPLKAGLNDAIDRINDFIVANSLSPVTKTELEKRAASVTGDVSQLCRPGGPVAAMLKSFKSMPHDKFMSSVADLLSVPRPPVMNPCL
jgi:hypothetical protein